MTILHEAPLVLPYTTYRKNEDDCTETVKEEDDDKAVGNTLSQESTDKAAVPKKQAKSKQSTEGDLITNGQEDDRPP